MTLLIESDYCSPDEFIGHIKEKKRIERIKNIDEAGRVILISGVQGSGKTSFLNYIGSLFDESQIITKQILSSQSNILLFYISIINELKEHGKAGWFYKIWNNNDIQTIFGVCSDIIRNRLGPDIERHIKNPQDYNDLIDSFSKLVIAIGNLLNGENQQLVILIDDAHHSFVSNKGVIDLFKKLKEILPNSILFIFTFLREKAYEEYYNELDSILQDYQILELDPFNSNDVREFVFQRYKNDNFYDMDNINDEIIQYLDGNYPSTIIDIFKSLKYYDCDLNRENIIQASHKIKSAEKNSFETLNDTQKDLARTVSIMDHDAPLSIISCVMSPQDDNQLKDKLKLKNQIMNELNQISFLKCHKEYSEENPDDVVECYYNFKSPSFRKACLMVDDQRKKLNCKALECFNKLKDKLDPILWEIMINEYFLRCPEGIKAEEFNQSSSRQFNLLNTQLASKLNDKAIESSIESSDNEQLLIAYSNQGFILEAEDKPKVSIEAFQKSQEIGQK
jgi:hypothetical protein